jgi:hypothetical protein
MSPFVRGRRVLQNSTVLLGLAIASSLLSAQDTRTFDLPAKSRADTVTIRPGEYRIRIKNLVPKYRYAIAVSEGVEDMKPLSTVVGMAVANCPLLTRAQQTLDTVSAEAAVPAMVSAAREALNKEAAAVDCSEVAGEVRGLVDRTEHVVDVYAVRAGEFLLIDVIRLDDTGGSTARWSRRYTTGASGEWRVTYGYVFPAFARLSGRRLIREGVQYYSKALDTARWVVTPEAQAPRFNAIPSLMFTYAPADAGAWSWNRLSAGLAVDLAKPMLFLGTGVTYRSNLVVSVGAAFRQERVLAGQYAPGDTIKSALTAAQLHIDAFRLRPFLGVTLLFDKNPFKKEGEKPGEAAGEKPAAKTGESGKEKTTMPSDESREGPGPRAGGE